GSPPWTSTRWSPARPAASPSTPWWSPGPARPGSRGPPPGTGRPEHASAPVQAEPGAGGEVVGEDPAVLVVGDGGAGGGGPRGPRGGRGAGARAGARPRH